MIAEICLSFFLSFVMSAWLLPRLMRLFSYETDFFDHPAWVYVPGILMWTVFFRTFPSQSNLIAGIAAAIGFVVSMWYWRSMKSIYD